MIKGLILQILVFYAMYAQGVSLTNYSFLLSVGFICLIIGDGLTRKDCKL